MREVARGLDGTQPHQSGFAVPSPLVGRLRQLPINPFSPSVGKGQSLPRTRSGGEGERENMGRRSKRVLTPYLGNRSSSVGNSGNGACGEV